MAIELHRIKCDADNKLLKRLVFIDVFIANLFINSSRDNTKAEFLRFEF